MATTASSPPWLKRTKVQLRISGGALEQIREVAHLLGLKESDVVDALVRAPDNTAHAVTIVNAVLDADAAAISAWRNEG